MKDKEKDILDIKKLLTPVDPKELQEFEHVMKTDVIPKILKVVDDRRMSAAKSRLWQLKC